MIKPLFEIGDKVRYIGYTDTYTIVTRNVFVTAILYGLEDSNGNSCDAYEMELEAV